eukprot:CAMPEP_0194496534 /NCGR_PEP_ID=MMETSP0253-20130528/13778_1 /TAXON_ID=2966 /ORGANISM="Noctiluca scintillans" /LENGTH=172 /DNA_ID=CAMNT_0039337943 /DNA_START=53 /DNA_END=571 /DNA_ORIENTATION=+
MSSSVAAGVLNRICLEPPTDPGPPSFAKLPVLLEGTGSGSVSDTSTRDSVACSNLESECSSSVPSTREVECNKESSTGDLSLEHAAPSVTVGFESPDGGRREIMFLERPLGMKYSSSSPLTVTKVNANSHAQELGVKLGWKLRSIEEQDLAGMPTKEVLSLLRHKTNVLKLV